MKIVAVTGSDDIAVVYTAEMNNGKLVEFAESISPPQPREKKWILTISTLFGCPVSCRFCDAGGSYKGKLSYDDIITQIDFLVQKRFSGQIIPVEKFKIQFARMGEPSLNDSILAVLENLKNLYDAPGLLISFSTIAPARREKFFTRLLDIKDRLFQGRFQFQFSLHTTDNRLRRWLVPCRTWSFEQMAEYGKIFRKSDDKKITLNFALAREMPLETSELLKFFDPDDFLIKITPVNPTFAASKNRIRSLINNKQDYGVIELLKSSGYEVILSIGEPEENLIGSNCGQYIEKFKQERKKITGGYTYFSP